MARGVYFEQDAQFIPRKTYSYIDADDAQQQNKALFTFLCIYVSFELKFTAQTVSISK